MTRGFYTLGSSMINQNHMLSAISNNIANVNTPGFKKSTVLTKTFGDMVMNRVGQGKTELGNVSMMRSDDISATIHSQGILKQTQRTLDFSITGQGFFAVQSDKGVVYTRSGSFDVDTEGYLSLAGVGRVVGNNGPIKVKTDSVTSDGKGNLYGADGKLVDKLAIYNFENYDNLITVGEGMYSGGNAEKLTDAAVQSKTIEGSNVDIGKEMSTSIATQRILQSVAQSLKMYDQTMQSATTQIGRI